MLAVFRLLRVSEYFNVSVGSHHRKMSWWRVFAKAAISVSSFLLLLMISSMLVNIIKSDRCPLSLLTSGGLPQKLMMSMVFWSCSITSATSCLTRSACFGGTPDLPKAT